MKYWLGNSRLDRFVLRALKRVPNTGNTPVTAMTHHVLYTTGVVDLDRLFPSEDEVYASLQRLMQTGLAERYVDFVTGGIRYRARVYPSR